MKFKKSIILLIIIILSVIAILTILKREDDIIVNNNFDNFSKELVNYKEQNFDISFSYPYSWGNFIEKPANDMCPDEDTYRTQETLLIYDKEVTWEDYILPESQSFIRKGIRFRYLDTNKICGNDLLYKLATKEIVGEILSSVPLTSINVNNFYGVYNNGNASRLDTEYRKQYTLFGKDKNGKLFVMQAYFSFIPYYGSRELNEIEGMYKGDIDKYIEKGNTSLNIRLELEKLKNVVLSITSLQ